MKKVYSIIMMLAMVVAALSFTACSSDDDKELGNGSNSGGKLLVGKWIPYTWDDDDYSFLEDVGWLQLNSNKTFTIYAYDKTKMFKGNWEYAETSNPDENKTLKLSIDGLGDFWYNSLPNTPKKEIDDYLIGGTLYFIIEDIHSNYMRTIRFLFIYPNGQTERMTTRIEWRRE